MSSYHLPLLVFPKAGTITVLRTSELRTHGLGSVFVMLVSNTRFASVVRLFFQRLCSLNSRVQGDCMGNVVVGMYCATSYRTSNYYTGAVHFDGSRGHLPGGLEGIGRSVLGATDNCVIRAKVSRE